MSDDSRKDDKHDDVMIERDHPQTRKGEPDARGSSEWREDVVPPAGKGDEEGQGQKVSELADEAESTRRQGLGEDSRNSLGGDKASSE
jgi:hypothetical protein